MNVKMGENNIASFKSEYFYATEGFDDQINSKYKDVWKRVHMRLLVSIRISKMMKNISLFCPRILSELNNEDDLTIMLKKHEALLKTARSIKNTKIIPISIFHPSEGFKLYWNFLLGVCLLYTAIVTPFVLAFIISRDFDQWFFIDSSLTVIFFLDVIITLNTAYLDEEGILVYNRKQIFMNYLKGWLIIDVIACIPYDLIQYSLNPTGTRATYNTLTKLVRLKSLPRLFRLSKVLVLFKEAKAFPLIDSVYYFFSVSHSGIQLFSTIIMILLSLHIATCLWYFVARFYEFSPDTWIARQGLLDSDNFDKYLTSLYWAVTTLGTIGYGDIVPKTVGEILFAMCWMIVAIYFLSFAISSLSTMISQNEEGKKKLLDKKLILIDNYVEENRIPRKIKQKMQNYVKENFDKEAYDFADTFNLFNDFSIPLRKEIVENFHHNSIKQFEFFQNKSERFIYTVVPLLRTEFIPSGEFIYTEDELPKNMHFVLKGKCHYLTNDRIKFKVIGVGSYFGDIEIFKRIKREYSVRASENMMIWTMCDELLNFIENDFRVIYEKMAQDANVRSQKLLVELAEIKAISKALETKETNLKEIRKLISDEFVRLVIENENKKKQQDDSNRIESKLEYCKKILLKNNELLHQIELRLFEVIKK